MREVGDGANGGEKRVTCTNCGKQVAPGARYCVHCGSEQSVPTPIAAVAAAAMARGRAREAANAAHAEPASRVAGGGSAFTHAERDAALAHLTGNGAANAADDAPLPPAYDGAPRRRGLAVALIACGALVAVIAAAVLVWRVESGRTELATHEEPAMPASQAVAPPPGAGAAGQAAKAPQQGAPPPLVDETSPPAPQPRLTPNQDRSPEANAPVEIRPLPPHSPAARSARRAPGAKGPSSADNGVVEPDSSSPAQAAPPPTAQRAPNAVAAAGSSTASHAGDRWKRLDDELSRCTREDFITRVICGQRVRFRYCDGYWGKVPQCPGNPAPEHGQ